MGRHAQQMRHSRTPLERCGSAQMPESGPMASPGAPTGLVTGRGARPNSSRCPHTTVIILADDRLRARDRRATASRPHSGRACLGTQSPQTTGPHSSQPTSQTASQRLPQTYARHRRPRLIRIDHGTTVILVHSHLSTPERARLRTHKPH
ncbi:hypothetical protein AAFF_G00164980 [Aldrovandia affinis]|uniref:Uncharacterized protein n=1 Tax=Aldrovandia affinis TaxID=143900 RepID=A0AAD7RQ08_9TELE|nr:hypothetical protein AAFF_G00164980 [Aldrovandia affinis]